MAHRPTRLSRIFVSFVVVLLAGPALINCGGGGGGGTPPPGGSSLPPIATSQAATSVTTSGAVLNGTVNPNGMATEAWFDYGLNPLLLGASSTTKQPIGSGVAAVPVNYTASRWMAGTTYYYRVCASSAAGMTLGTILSCTTGSRGSAPTVQTLAASSVGTDNASLSGSVNPNGQATSAWFEWGTDSGLSGYSSTTGQSVGAGSSAVIVNASLSSLSSSTPYYYRAAASNATGTSRGSIVSFTTSAPSVPPAVTTLGATNIGLDNATLNGQVNPNGLATTAYFEWGVDNQLVGAGVTAGQSIGSGGSNVAVTAGLTGLTDTTTYYYRAVGTNSAGASSGAIGSFTTLATPVAATIRVYPKYADLGVGKMQSLRASVLDQYGNAMPGATVTWNSDRTAIATVDASGRITAVAEGSATVTASVGLVVSTPVPVNVDNADAVIRVIPVYAAYIAYDPFSRKIYATHPSSVPGRGNTVSEIDPYTGAFVSSIAVGSEPWNLVASDDGRFLYLGLSGSGSIQRLKLSPLATDIQFSLGNGWAGPRFVEDFAVLPENSWSIAVARKYNGVSPPHAGVAVYDNDVKRPLEGPEHTGSDEIEFGADASTLYGLNTATTEFGFRTMAVSPSGVAVTSVTPGLINTFGQYIKCDGGKIYANLGRVIDPATRTLAGSFAVAQTIGTVVVPDTSNGRTFFVSPSGYQSTSVSLLSFDQSNYLLVGQQDLLLGGVYGRVDVGYPIRWGAYGIAFTTSANEIWLIRNPALFP